jgi:hypothetical protein
VVGSALARDPEERYPDARTMAADLGRALHDLGGTPHALTATGHAALIPQPPPAPPPTSGGGGNVRVSVSVGYGFGPGWGSAYPAYLRPTLGPY